MKLTWLHKGCDTRRLILVAAGWSTAPGFYRNLKKKGWDIALIWNDSDNQDADYIAIINEIESAYSTVYLYGWSLGVTVSERLYEAGLRPTAAFAINGTARPASNAEGIPVTIFRGTAKHLDEDHLKRFRARISGGIKDYYKIAELFEDSLDWQVLQRQLFAEEAAAHPEALPWTLAFVGKADAVFLPEMQIRHWQRRGVDLRVLDAPHYIPLQSVIDSTIVDLERAGRRFARSVPTYDNHASAQRMIASRLASLAAEVKGEDCAINGMLEIGCGTGLLSHSLGRLFKVQDATFVDLYPCGPFDIARDEHYIVGDAEAVVESLDGRYDLITSASAIQWFSDTSRFLKACSDLLADDGVVAISSFTRGNLAELDSMRTSNIGYLSAMQLRMIASQYFSRVEVIEEELVLTFSTPAEALRHLQLTGVTASTPASMSAAELRRRIADYPLADDGSAKLTFRPVYIIARK